jgi:hypothetical protein
VIEDALVDDYVTEIFFEGLKGAALMVYLGAPNIHEVLACADWWIQERARACARGADRVGKNDDGLGW